LQAADDDAGISERLAEALCRAGRYGEAIPVLQQLLNAEQAQQSTGVRLRLAEALLAVNQPEAARVQAQAVLQSDPNQVSALLLLAQAWAAAGDTGAALRTAERALQLQPQDARVQELTAALEWSAGQESRARERARRLREIDPANPVALHILSLGSY
jgi:Flp pilus assembly protein TadD